MIFTLIPINVFVREHSPFGKKMFSQMERHPVPSENIPDGLFLVIHQVSCMTDIIYILKDPSGLILGI